MAHPEATRTRTLTTGELAAILTVIDRFPTLAMHVQRATREVVETVGPHLPAVLVVAENGRRAVRFKDREREALTVVLDLSQPRTSRHAAVQELVALHRQGSREFLPPGLAKPSAWRACRRYAQEERRSRQA